jgi:hypothetical protein
VRARKKYIVTMNGSRGVDLARCNGAGGGQGTPHTEGRESERRVWVQVCRRGDGLDEASATSCSKRTGGSSKRGAKLAGAGIPIPISIPIPPPQGGGQLAATRKMWSIPFHPIQHARAYRLIHPLLILVQC